MRIKFLDPGELVTEIGGREGVIPAGNGMAGRIFDI